MNKAQQYNHNQEIKKSLKKEKKALIKPDFLSKFQQLNNKCQIEEYSSNGENASQNNNYLEILSSIIEKNEGNYMTNNNINNYYDNIKYNVVGNNLNNIFQIISSDFNNCKNYNYCFNKFGNITTDVNNYNIIISQIQNNETTCKDNNDNSEKNNLPFSIYQNQNKYNINFMENLNNVYNNNDFMQTINQINKLNGINNINIYNFNNSVNIKNIEYINNSQIDNNIPLNSKKLNISNISNYSNSLNQMNNIKDNNINLNQNSFIDNNSNIESNYENISFSNDSNNSKNNNDLITIMDKKYADDFKKFVKNLSMPLVEFLCSSKGSFEIQKYIEKGQNQCKALLINLLEKKGLSKIMRNIYGNYFFQQMIRGAQGFIISKIISYISHEFINISKDPFGTFSIQALLDEVSSVKEEQQILMYIKNHEIEMAFDKNATYVLQKIILSFPDIHRVSLNEIILSNFKNLCMDSNGICLIKNFIKTNTLISNKKRIIEEIVKNFVVLAESPYGNYGIQYIMDNWDRNELNDFIKKIIENIYKLSIQQFSSNVVEKAIEKIDEENREYMIRKLCFENNFILLLKNKFGRFVLQKAINYMNQKLRNEFEINLINKISSNKYSYKDINKIKKFVMKITNNQFPNDSSFKLGNDYFVKNNINLFGNFDFRKKMPCHNFGISFCEK